ncbi:MAG TPA: heme ABC exporter ATP-binding protein CcmA [Anaerohalosphaeraceae bacterium]|jgi:heme exporter protein A|nr:heme ABC exporter ATP-binding protein CcmA [Anaerohalosphaeraceae bacterium]HRT87904.1 heme ABC exporter ATP-binding protein CcmA [Anaerohalosphaeraceae bacterium]
MITLKSISKAFEHRPVLKNVDLAIGSGESVFLCGINGVGKSTLLRIAAGLLSPDAGHVEICGRDMTKDPEGARLHLGFISHKSMIYDDLTVLENLMFAARLYGLPEPRRRAADMLDEMGLSGFAYDRAAILSRGMLQRLAIARALVHRPAVLLADEPFTGLDGKAAAHLTDVLQGFGGAGHAVLMTTHDVAAGLQCCRRVIVLHAGSILFDAATEGIDPVAFARDYVTYAGGRP